MEAYQSFAKLYDLFMDGVPYDAWCEQTQRLLGRFGITEGIVAELGCGTGNCTERLAAAGFDMIGIDNAEEMLEEAMQKKLLSGSNSLYLCQDMREFELYGTCRAMISRCDSMNYLCTAEDLREVFRLVNNYLDPGSTFSQIGGDPCTARLYLRGSATGSRGCGTYFSRGHGCGDGRSANRRERAHADFIA